MSSRRYAVVGALAAASTFLSGIDEARAEPPASAVMKGEIDAYFTAEKSEALIFLGTGVASVGLGSFLVTRDSQVARGAGYPLVAIGILQTLFAATYHGSIDARVVDLKKQLDASPAAFKSSESERIAGVNRRFVIFRYTELGLIAAGAVVSTIGFAKKIDIMKGLGIGLGVESALFLTLDLFAERRAHVYAERLQRFPVAVSIEPSPTGAFRAPGVNLSFNRSF